MQIIFNAVPAGAVANRGRLRRFNQPSFGCCVVMGVNLDKSRIIRLTDSDKEARVLFFKDLLGATVRVENVLPKYG